MTWNGKKNEIWAARDDLCDRSVVHAVAFAEPWNICFHDFHFVVANGAGVQALQRLHFAIHRPFMRAKTRA